MMTIQASQGAEIADGQSPADLSVRSIGEVRPLNQRQSRMDQILRPPSQHDQRARKARNHADFSAAHKRHAAMRAHNEANEGTRGDMAELPNS